MLTFLGIKKRDVGTEDIAVTINEQKFLTQLHF